MSEEKASRLIDELEAKLGRSLFENRKKGKPTSVGLKLFRQWSPSISQLKLLSSDTEVSADTLHFAFPFTTGAVVFSSLTTLFAERYPKVKFDIQLATVQVCPFGITPICEWSTILTATKTSESIFLPMP